MSATTIAAVLPAPRRRARGVNPAVYLVLAIAVVFFVLPLYVMVSTSLKTMDEIRGGNVLAAPAAIDLSAWVRAWTSACTGSTCAGIRQGFLNSVKITVPSVLLSTALGAIGGYTLSFWRFRGATTAFAILTFGMFVPFQVFIFPLIRINAALGLYGTLAGIVLIHVTFGLPVTTLMFRNYYATIPLELFKAARVDGAGYIRCFASIMLPLSKPMVIVAVMWQATATWNDYIFGLVFAGRNNQPMTAQLQVLARSDTGVPEYNVIMAATLLTALVPLSDLFRCWTMVRPRHRGRSGQGMSDTTVRGARRPLVFVSSSPTQEIVVLAFDRTTEMLSELGRYPATPGGEPVPGGMPLAFSPDRRFVYTGIREAPHPVVSLTVRSSDGALTVLGSAALPERVASLATDHAGRHLFAVSYGGHFLSISPIDSAGVAGPPSQVIRDLAQVHGIAIDPTDRHVYVACMGADAVLAYAFDAESGRLDETPFDVQRSKQGAGPRHLALAPGARHLYAVTEHHGTIMAFERDNATGRLTLIQTIGFLPDTIMDPVAPAVAREPPGAADIHISPDGRFVYASDRPTNSIGAFRRDPRSGRIAPIENVSAEATPRSFAIDTAGDHLLCLGVSSGQVGIYAVDQAIGSLRRRSTLTVAEMVDWIEIVELP